MPRRYSNSYYINANNITTTQSVTSRRLFGGSRTLSSTYVNGVRVGGTESYDNGNRSIGIFKLVLLALLLVTLYRSLNGVVDGRLSFTLLLQWLTNAPQIDLKWIYTFNRVLNLPVLNVVFTPIVSLLLYVVAGILQLLLYVSWIGLILYI